MSQARHPDRVGTYNSTHLATLPAGMALGPPRARACADAADEAMTPVNAAAVDEAAVNGAAAHVMRPVGIPVGVRSTASSGERNNNKQRRLRKHGLL